MIKSDLSNHFNIYCDESCHLENDGLKVMTLGAVWCPSEKVHEISIRLREIKNSYGLKPDFEIKWTKVSRSKAEFYLHILDYFFDDDDLHFRALVVPDKTKLNHEFFGQTHEEWYYKMYFEMLKIILDPKAHYRIYLDYKDTRGGSKVNKLHEILCSSMYDFSRQIIERVQIVRSHEVEILQLTDLLIGAVSYANRMLSANPGKLALVNRMRKRSTYKLTQSTLLKESKVNILCWQPTEKIQS
jgi:hypothetical protein